MPSTLEPISLMSCNVEYIEAGVKDNFPNDKLPYMFIKGTTINHIG